MNKKRQIIHWFVFTSMMCLLLMCHKLSGQENILFTDYNNSKIFINPAFSGSTPYMEISMGYHKQWTGTDGAPKSSIISAHTPLNNKPIGIGAMIYSNKIGILNETGFFVNYAYKINMPKNKILALGFQAGVVNKEIRWSEIITYDPNFNGDDPSIPNVNINSIAPNFGLGIYYSSSKFHLGLSTPRLLKNTYAHKNNMNKNMKFNVSNIYFYINSGFALTVNPNIQTKPSVLIYSSLNSTINYNFNLNFSHTKGISTGGSFRSGKYWSLNIGYEFNSKFGVSYTYENTLNKLQRGDHTSHEIFINYKRSIKKNNYTSPRFF